MLPLNDSRFLRVEERDVTTTPSFSVLVTHKYYPASLPLCSTHVLSIFLLTYIHSPAESSLHCKPHGGKNGKKLQQGLGGPSFFSVPYKRLLSSVPCASLCLRIPLNPSWSPVTSEPAHLSNAPKLFFLSQRV